MASRAVPYTGGDVKKSGELGKMFDIPTAPTDPTAAAAASLAPPKVTSRHSSSSGSVRSAPNSGPAAPLPPTGLITSGPASGPRRSSGQLSQLGQSEASAGAVGGSKAAYGAAVTNLGEEVRIGVRVSKGVMWVFGVVVVMAVVVGVFMMATVKNAVILVVVAAVAAPIVLLLAVELCLQDERGFRIVTCGSIPLESSYQRIPRCVYASTELYEYKGWGGKSANSKHRPFSWGLRYSEKHVGDFYISDFHSGLRALVKAGYGAKVAPFVKPATVVDVTKENRELSPGFLRWLADRNLSSDDRIMRLEEGFTKDDCCGSAQPATTGCQWLRCLLPTYIEGLILKCDESQNTDVIPV
ncbi:hypothetical protein Syun_026888 [Stephania yunnanensis]|uniref:Uncharacterized protein n=1 Tax=Stephania yunnanensis TaxID=152371 RepID=A0AAP0HPE9_9MAGN